MERIAFIISYAITWLLLFAATTKSAVISENDVCNNYTSLNAQYGKCNNYNRMVLYSFDSWTGDGIREIVGVLCNNATDIINCMTSATARCPDAAYIRGHVERLYSFCGSDNWFVNDVDPVMGSGDLFQVECMAVHEYGKNTRGINEYRDTNTTMSARENMQVKEHNVRTDFNFFLDHFRKQLANEARDNGCTVPLRDIFMGWLFQMVISMPTLGYSLDSDLQNSITKLMAE